jgi:hypothetical protein
MNLASEQTMKLSTMSASRDELCLDDAELAGITGGKLLAQSIDLLANEYESIPWTKLNPTGERIPLQPLERMPTKKK